LLSNPRVFSLTVLFAIALGLLAAAGQAPIQPTSAKSKAPIVIGHRGASGYRPEHTLASYQLAIDMGADYIEPDLVSTQDGVLVARHENEISGTTNVAGHPEFANRRVTKTIDGVSVTGWFTEDFTLAELKTVRARERLPDLRPENAKFDGMFEVPTLEEVIQLVQGQSPGRGRDVGIYPETKHPTYFDSIDLSLEEPLVALLERYGYKDANDPVFIQSFEVGNLKQLNQMTKLPLVQLADAAGRPFDFALAGDPRTYRDMVTPQGLAEIATYADGLGPNKSLLIPRDSNNRLLSPTTVVQDAHAQGLKVHPWTFRSENSFLPANFQMGNPADPAFQRQHGDAIAEDKLFLSLGIDGFFTDFPDTGVAARDEFGD
jgi:glycerophosphoryl diester phosphodiesterase